jgi:hypothetical protein
MCIDPLLWVRDDENGFDRPRCAGPTLGPQSWFSAARGIGRPLIFVGAGIAGLSIAYGLVCTSKSVIVLDPRRHDRATDHLASELDDD